MGIGRAIDDGQHEVKARLQNALGLAEPLLDHDVSFAHDETGLIDHECKADDAESDQKRCHESSWVNHCASQRPAEKPKSRKAEKPKSRKAEKPKSGRSTKSDVKVNPGRRSALLFFDDDSGWHWIDGEQLTGPVVQD